VNDFYARDTNITLNMLKIKSPKQMKIGPIDQFFRMESFDNQSQEFKITKVN